MPSCLRIQKLFRDPRSPSQRLPLWPTPAPYLENPDWSTPQSILPTGCPVEIVTSFRSIWTQAPMGLGNSCQFLFLGFPRTERDPVQVNPRKPRILHWPTSAYPCWLTAAEPSTMEKVSAQRAGNVGPENRSLTSENCAETPRKRRRLETGEESLLYVSLFLKHEFFISLPLDCC